MRTASPGIPTVYGAVASATPRTKLQLLFVQYIDTLTQCTARLRPDHNSVTTQSQTSRSSVAAQSQIRSPRRESTPRPHAGGAPARSPCPPRPRDTQTAPPLITETRLQNARIRLSNTTSYDENDGLPRQARDRHEERIKCVFKCAPSR
eukprot:COSAG06_NODE_15681_length_1053_cov_0.971698_1_plen_148_part_10